MAKLFENSFNDTEKIPDWLAQAKTLLTAKSERTQEAKN